MPLPIQLISTDFDGTLHADFENPPVPLRLERQLAALQQQGARWMINTGRDLSSLLESLARARLSIWPDYLGLVEREIYVREGQEYHPLADWNNTCTADHVTLFARMRPDVARLTAWIEARYKATIYEDPFSPLCMIASSNEVADQIMVYLEDYCSGMENLTVVRNDIYARFSHTKYNKGTVVQEVARKLGIVKEAIFAAGDHLNDIPMLDGVHAGMVAAPGNAIPEVKALIKKVGGYQSDEPWGHGIASALEHFGGGRGQEADIREAGSGDPDYNRPTSSPACSGWRTGRRGNTRGCGSPRSREEPRTNRPNPSPAPGPCTG